jgi:hypothetical protein
MLQNQNASPNTKHRFGSRNLAPIATRISVKSNQQASTP